MADWAPVTTTTRYPTNPGTTIATTRPPTSKKPPTAPAVQYYPPVRLRVAVPAAALLMGASTLAARFAGASWGVATVVGAVVAAAVAARVGRRRGGNNPVTVFFWLLGMGQVSLTEAAWVLMGAGALAGVALGGGTYAVGRALAAAASSPWPGRAAALATALPPAAAVSIATVSFLDGPAATRPAPPPV